MNSLILQFYYLDICKYNKKGLIFKEKDYILLLKTRISIFLQPAVYKKHLFLLSLPSIRKL